MNICMTLNPTFYRNTRKNKVKMPAATKVLHSRTLPNYEKATMRVGLTLQTSRKSRTGSVDLQYYPGRNYNSIMHLLDLVDSKAYY